MIHSVDFNDKYSRDPHDGERVLLVVDSDKEGAPKPGMCPAVYDEDIDRWRLLDPPYGFIMARDYILTGDRVTFLPDLYVGRDGPMRRIEDCEDIGGMDRWEPRPEVEQLYVGQFSFEDGAMAYMTVNAVDEDDAKDWLVNRRAFMRDRYKEGDRPPHVRVRKMEVPRDWSDKLNTAGRSTMLATIWG